jgi:glycosyltransferase involved in cell wall biosynthesis
MTTKTRERPRVIYWNNIPAPYMVERFNAVADRGVVDLEVWFSRRSEADRSWAVVEETWRFPYRYLPRLGTPEHGLALPLPLLRDRPDLVVSLYGAPEFVLGWAVTTMMGIQTAFWAEVTFDAWVSRRPHREWLKRRMFRRVGGIITAGDDGRRFARRYGAPNRRIFFARHVVDVAHFAEGTSRSKSERMAFRSAHGLDGTVFIYVGRLWRPKGLVDLLEAFDLLCRRGVKATLLLVGDGSDEASLRARAAPLGDRVVFAGFREKDALPTWYSASDVFVLPTHGDPYGLVIDEAMACGLPIIATGAVGEIAERVQQGRNGTIVRVGDREGLALAMARMAQDPKALRAMGAESRRMIEGWTPERWASDFEAAVSALVTGQRRAN